MKLAVLNQGGGDPFLSYEEGVGVPSGSIHPPVNYHAYAACTGGWFCDHWKQVPPQAAGVLLLLRKRMGGALRAARELRQRGFQVWVSWKESGIHQVNSALAIRETRRGFCQLTELAGGFVSSTPDLVSLYRAVGWHRGAFIATPYPVDVSGWDFSRPPEERQGVMIGTREFDVPTRNHFSAVCSAAEVAAKQATHATLIVPRRGEGLRIASELARKFPALRLVSGPLSYPDYLHLMAGHRLVFQLDRSRVPGQVAGDALLCGIPCVGGDGAVEMLAFPNWSGRLWDDCALVHKLEELLDNPSPGYVAAALARKHQDLHFTGGAKALKSLFEEQVVDPRP
jgi:hypothetical protein